MSAFLNIIAAAWVFSITNLGHAASIEEQTMSQLNAIREIKAEGGEGVTDKYNEQLDDAWKFFADNKPQVLPIMRRELKIELGKPKPSQMFLLDIGYYIRLQENQADKDLGRGAFFAIDPDAEIVQWNGQQFFQFAHAVVPDHDARTLSVLDKAFLRGNVTAFIPQHSLSLSETLVCVFLYGIYGEGAEERLASQLTDPAIVDRVLEILIWIGSPASVPAVEKVLKGARNYETFARATAFMMRSGGPKGRAAMLALKTQSLDPESREYYAKVRDGIEATTYERFKEQFERLPPPGPVDDSGIKKRLSIMYQNYGKDDEANPRSFLETSLPSTYLVTELSRIRSRMFYRISDEALSDVEMTNALLSALYYKTK